MNVHEQGKVLRALKQAPAAWLLSRTSRWLRDIDAPRTADGGYDGADLVRWFVSRVREEYADADPLMRGGGSDALEDYRRERARGERRRNDEEEKSLVSRASVAAQLSDIARVFQSEAEALRKIHGDVIADAIGRMVDRAEAEWLKAFGGNPSSKKRRQT
jgi:hypothetical protein